ncbi:hypothetical protein HBP72_01240 [Listeria welshimeri]|nr:hypothetical protein [Listeria welshimeri]MBC2344965.1 hypothetical protein [Listeria welshimeri]
MLLFTCESLNIVRWSKVSGQNGAKKVVDDIIGKTKEVGKSIGKGVKSVGEKIGNAASGFMNGLGSVFG